MTDLDCLQNFGTVTNISCWIFKNRGSRGRGNGNGIPADKRDSERLINPETGAPCSHRLLRWDALHRVLFPLCPPPIDRKSERKNLAAAPCHASIGRRATLRGERWILISCQAWQMSVKCNERGAAFHPCSGRKGACTALHTDTLLICLALCPSPPFYRAWETRRKWPLIQAATMLHMIVGDDSHFHFNLVNVSFFKCPPPKCPHFPL